MYDDSLADPTELRPVILPPARARRAVPSISSIVLLVAVMTLVAVFLVGVMTQHPTTGAATTTTTEAPAGSLEGLVLDGSGVTTTAPLSSAGRPVEPIPHRAGVGT